MTEQNKNEKNFTIFKKVLEELYSAHLDLLRETPEGERKEEIRNRVDLLRSFIDWHDTTEHVILTLGTMAFLAAKVPTVESILAVSIAHVRGEMGVDEALTIVQEQSKRQQREQQARDIPMGKLGHA